VLAAQALAGRSPGASIVLLLLPVLLIGACWPGF